MPKISRALVEQIEYVFMVTYVRDQTEDRLLIYVGQDGRRKIVRPEMRRTRASVQGDVQLTIQDDDGALLDLAFDLHSHHLMGAFWSGTDNANERIRGPIFGVFSWKDNTPTWLFRRFTGEFTDLAYEEVVSGG
ncbi:MAG TPA: hypothetical protein VD902_21825 [Symbiobacteriaceae bacterium]|nr:hypothetical protein [Symbiobacteriaceae bacterium]